MNKNVGNTERAIRIGGGLILVVLAASGTVGLWGYLGLLAMVTGAIGWCPPYAMLGINTCAKKD
jgi:hypothetical protein